MSLSLADFSGDLQAAVAGAGNVVEKCHWNDIPKESRCLAANGLIFAAGQGP
jgi:hypothetical protein